MFLFLSLLESIQVSLGGRCDLLLCENCLVIETEKRILMESSEKSGVNVSVDNIKPIVFVGGHSGGDRP